MSYPYISDLMFGSEMSSVGGNLPSKVVSGGSGEGGGGDEPVVNPQIYQSNKANCVKVNIEDDPVKETIDTQCYYVVDLSSIEEGEGKDNLRSVLSKLEVQIIQTVHTGNTFSNANNLTSVLEELGLDSSSWSIYISDTFAVSLHTPDGSVYFDFYLEGDPEPVTVATMDEIWVVYDPNYKDVEESSSYSESLTFTFTAKS